MAKPKVGSVNKVSPRIPEDPNSVANFIREATNYIAFIEDAHLTKLVYDKDCMKDKIATLEAGIQMRRDQYVGSSLDQVPKEHKKTATMTNQYIDYNVYKEETTSTVLEIRQLKRELADLRNKITAWNAAKDQYDRAIHSSTVILAWAKASLKLGGSNF